MNIKFILVFLTMLTGMSGNSQRITLNGKFADAFTEVPLPQVKVSIERFFNETYSNSEGEFSLELSNIGVSTFIGTNL